MELINNRDFSLHDTAVSIGKFDTVHKGHRFLMDTLVKLASEKGLTSVALALDFKNGFTGTHSGTRIDSWDKTVERFQATGIDVLIRYGFDSADAMATPEEFVRDVLTSKLGCRLVVVGDDFRFGRDRQGDTDTLKLLGEQYGFETVVVKRLEVEGFAVSSTQIRKLINEGNALEAGKFL